MRKAQMREAEMANSGAERNAAQRPPCRRAAGCRRAPSWDGTESGKRDCHGI